MNGVVVIKQISRSGTAQIAALLSGNKYVRVTSYHGEPHKYFEISKCDAVNGEVVSISDFKKSCCKVLSSVEEGDSVTVTRRGRGANQDILESFVLTRMKDDEVVL